MNDFLANVTGFLATLLPWVVLVGFIWILRRLSTIERQLMALSFYLALKEGVNPFSPFKGNQRGGVKDAEVVDRRGQGNGRSQPEG